MIIVIWLTIERKRLQLTQKDNNYQRLFVLSVLAIQLRMILAGVSQMMMAKTLQRLMCLIIHLGKQASQVNICLFPCWYSV